MADKEEVGTNAITLFTGFSRISVTPRTSLRMSVSYRPLMMTSRVMWSV